MRRSFTGPVWLLVIFGLLQSVVSYAYIRLMQGIITTNGHGELAPFVFRVSIFPMVIFGEALVYWLIRKRNRAQMLSWTHSAIFCVAFLLTGFVALMSFLHEPVAGALRSRQVRIVEAAVFWALVAVSHIAFLQVLILAFRKEPPAKNAAGDSENLLDDVLL